jgi:hypothetical protein
VDVRVLTGLGHDRLSDEVPAWIPYAVTEPRGAVSKVFGSRAGRRRSCSGWTVCSPVGRSAAPGGSSSS